MLRFLFLVTLFVTTPFALANKASVALVVEDDAPPAQYELIGEYLVNSITKITEGKVNPTPITSTTYRVYSNGSEVRLYKSDLSEAFHSYTIYSSDGITKTNAAGAIVLQPGLQARQSESSLVKQLSLTQDSLTITQFPPISDTVIVTYAKRVVDVK